MSTATASTLVPLKTFTVGRRLSLLAGRVPTPDGAKGTLPAVTIARAWAVRGITADANPFSLFVRALDMARLQVGETVIMAIPHATKGVEGAADVQFRVLANIERPGRNKLIALTEKDAGNAYLLQLDQHNTHPASDEMIIASMT